LLVCDLALRGLPLHAELRQSSTRRADESVGVKQYRSFRQTGGEGETVYATSEAYQPAFRDDLAQCTQNLAAATEVRELAGEKHIFTAFRDALLNLGLQ